MTRFFIGVDIGGTKIAVGLVNDSGEVICRTRVPMVANATAGDGLDAVRNAIDSISNQLGPADEVAGFGDLRSRLTDRCVNPAPSKIPLLKARYGEDAGIVGAAALCMAAVSADRVAAK